MPPRKKKLPEAPTEVPRIHPSLLDRVVPVGSLAGYYMNPNEGDVDWIAHSLQNNGQFKAITVNIGTYTGRPMEILAGNHTWLAAQQLEWPDIARDLVDVSEQAAARIVADDNHTAEMARRDPEKLAELLGLLGPDLATSTYTDKDLVKLLGEQGPAADDSALLGEQTFSVIVTCRDEKHQLELLQALESEGLDARAMVQ